MRRSSSTTGVPEVIAAARWEVSEPSLGDTTRPSTRFSVSTRTASCSTASSSSVLTRTTSYPFAWATSDTPRRAREKNGFSMSDRTTPSVLVEPVIMLRAIPLGR